LQSPLASCHSSRHVRRASNPSVADRCPLQTDRKTFVRSALLRPAIAQCWRHSRPKKC
jgi:hypothetical protein